MKSAKVKVTAGVKRPKSLSKAKLGGAKNCWPGYTKKGSKMLNGKVVNNCVKGM
jgi:hypothetical protein